MVIVTSLVILLVFLYYLLTKNHNYWQSKGAPFEKPFFIFGNFYDVVRGQVHISEKIRELYRKHKTPYVGIYVFHQPALLIRSPDLLKKVMVKDFDNFVNRPIASDKSVDPLAIYSLFSSKDLVWRSLRARLTPLFTPSKVKMMLPLMEECVKDLTTCLKENEGEDIEVKTLFKKYSVDVISSCAFGINARSFKDEESEVFKMASQLVDFTSPVRNFSVLSFFFLPALVKVFRLTFGDKVACDYFIKIFDKTMKERELLKLERHDLIDLLHNLKKNEAFAETFKFDDIKMAAQSISFFLAGYLTTSSIVALTSYELALNRDIQSRLRHELKNNEDLQKVKYLDMVLKETHRKYPLANFLNREVVKDYTFEETGLELKKGDQVFIPLSGLHYDPEYYPEPEKFNPERFDNEKVNITPFTYMPFGEGPRGCIGERFANLVSKLAIANVVKNFEIETTSSTAIPLVLNNSSLFFQNKGGLYLKMVQIKH